MIDIQEILQILPHSYPFLLIDRVLEFDQEKSLVALKNVTINEAFFVGHFPDHPVMPGVLIIEALAQAGGILAYKSTKTRAADGVIFYFAGIDKARFRRVVQPGDQLILKVKVMGSKRDIWKIEGRAYVEDELACSAEFLSARKTQHKKNKKEHSK